MNKILEIYNDLNKFGSDHSMNYAVIQPGKIEYRMRVVEKHLATHEVTHGGMIAAFMDAVMGVAALSMSAEKNCLVATVEFKINYLRPVKIGWDLLGLGKVDQEGKSLYICSGEIYNEDTKELLAKGMGTFKSYPIGKTGLDKKYSIT